jgi:hypothetical protein
MIDRLCRYYCMFHCEVSKIYIIVAREFSWILPIIALLDLHSFSVCVLISFKDYIPRMTNYLEPCPHMHNSSIPITCLIY